MNNFESKMEDDELSLDDLNDVVGGINRESIRTGLEKSLTRKVSGGQLMRMECTKCHNIFNGDVSKDVVVCPKCGANIPLMG